MYNLGFQSWPEVVVAFAQAVLLVFELLKEHWVGGVLT